MGYGEAASRAPHLGSGEAGRRVLSLSVLPLVAKRPLWLLITAAPLDLDMWRHH